MDVNINLENINQRCRICLKNGDFNIWSCNISTEEEPDWSESGLCTEDFKDKSFVEIMGIFCNNQDLLNLSEEFPLICYQCLEDVKFCYNVYKKIKFANVQLKNLYQETLNQCIEEEYLIEVVDEHELNAIENTNIVDTLEKEKISNLPQYKVDNVNELGILDKSSSKQITLDKNDTFIVTQFIPEALNATKKCVANQSKDNDGLNQPPINLLTVNLKAVEVKDLKNLDKFGSPHPFIDIAEPAIYVCQYCPQAFAKSDYLKTHIQKSHVCKFCTLPFKVTEDLFRHIREVHTENKCAICYKILSSRTNLRHHIKRVHRVELPANVTLIDFIKSPSLMENVDMLKEDLEAVDVDLNSQYMWKNNCFEIISENNSE